MSAEISAKEMLELVAKVSSMNEDDMAMFLALIVNRSEYAIKRGLEELTYDDRRHLASLFSMPEHKYVQFLCGHCQTLSTIYAEAQEFGVCTQGVYADVNGEFQLDWDDDCNFDIGSRLYRCSHCNEVIAEDILTLEELIKKADGDFVYPKRQAATINEELGILGK